MLMKYEYELLSYIATKGLKKVNNDLAVSIKRVNSDLDEDIQGYLDNLKLKGFITLEKDTITIKSEEWIKYFIEKLNDRFNANNLKIVSSFNKEEFYIGFKSNGTLKKFNLALNENDILSNNDNEEIIFMCKPNLYEDRIFWLDLLNNINLLMMFNSYLLDEISNMNKEVYRKIDVFDGINEAYINEIFDNSIKGYFQEKKRTIIEFDRDYAIIIKKIFRNENIRFYGVKFDNEVLLVLKRSKEIIFLTIKDNDVVYSNVINSEIDYLNNKIQNKMSEYRKLLMFKENNVVDSSIKLISNLAAAFVPFTMIVNILGMLNLNISNFKNYKWLLFIAMIILSFIQIGIIRLIYIPAIKMSRFKWKL